MNIFILCDYYPPSRGGIQTHCYELTEYLKKNGDSVTVFTKKMNRNKEHIREAPFIDIKYLRGLSSMLSLTIFLIKAFLKEKPDIVHSHSYQPTLAAILAKKITKTKVQIVMTSHGAVAESTVTGRPFIYRKTFGALTKFLEIYSIKNSDFVISVDKYFEEYALKYIPRAKIKTIPNWVDTDIFNKNNTKNEIEELSGRSIIICCPRRLDKKNGLEYSIKAFALLQKYIKNSKLWLVGGGDYESPLRKLVKELSLEDKVVFFGYKRREEMPYYMNASDIILLTSPLGNFCFTLLEALACDKIVVATNVGNTLDFQNINSNTMILCEQEINDIARTLKNTIDGRYKTDKIQKAALEAVKNNYSKDVLLKKITGVYEKQIKSK